MTIYKCAACDTELEIEKFPAFDIIQIKPCEACLEAAEEGAREEGIEEGQSQTYKDGYDKGRQEGEVKEALGTVTGRSYLTESNIKEKEKVIKKGGIDP